jgi:hypothetical protein
MVAMAAQEDLNTVLHFIVIPLQAVVIPGSGEHRLLARGQQSD